MTRSSRVNVGPGAGRRSDAKIASLFLEIGKEEDGSGEPCHGKRCGVGRASQDHGGSAVANQFGSQRWCVSSRCLAYEAARWIQATLTHPTISEALPLEIASFHVSERRVGRLGPMHKSTCEASVGLIK
jgi:hypothetical protein